MSIPMSCAGCGTAFDLPDDLGGKTIRCTSCKAQMGVPAAAPDAGAKKPFGAKADAKTSPNGKSAGPKSAPAAKGEARSAPKAKVVAEVEEDEEDEAESSKGTKKKAAKGEGGKAKSGKDEKKAAGKKRRDDDDEDDDEKPARKKKRKNESGGSRTMMLVIGGGVVGLVLVGGLAAALLSGGSKKKTDDSASNTPASNEGPKPPAAAPPAGNTGSPEANTGGTPGMGGMPPGPGGMGTPATTPNPPDMMAGTPGANNGGTAPGMTPGMGNGPGGTGMAPGMAPTAPPNTIPTMAPITTPGTSPGTAPGANPGGTNPGGTAAKTDGNLKARIDAFLTASFDPAAGDFYTCEPRKTATTMAGTLRRYTYPDFRPAGSYKMASAGFRSAIDARGALLYVAYVTNILSAEGQPTERLAAVGSVAVYDLRAIRGQKTADGKPLEDGKDVKPVATIPVAHKIYGMELSEDGKSLYVLTTHGTTKKTPVLIAYDTATRKEAKRYEQFTEPARDMVKAADGKGLIIIEAPAKDKSSRVISFDPTAWAKVNTTKFHDAAVLDVAPLVDGSMIVSALSMSRPLKPGANPNPGTNPNPGMGTNPGGIPNAGLTPRPGFVPVRAPAIRVQRRPPGYRPPTFRPPAYRPPAYRPPAYRPPRPGRIGNVGGIGGRPAQPGTMPGNQPANNPQPPQQVDFHLYFVDANGVEVGELYTGARGPVSNEGYVEFDPTEKKLYVSSWRDEGLDVYDVTDPAAESGLKLETAILTARREPVGGHFFITPDGRYLVFQFGVVIDTAAVGGGLGRGTLTSGPPLPGGMPPAATPAMPPGVPPGTPAGAAPAGNPMPGMQPRKPGAPGTPPGP
jgi:hypothetical protein